MTTTTDSQTTLHPFEHLTPDTLLDAVESVDLKSDGRILALNSYENRVYQIGIENEQPLIAKFYRPNRWSDEQILEEHTFCQQLYEHELPVVPPIGNDTNLTLHPYQQYRFSLYPREGGHPPELDNLEHLNIIGRTLGRLHRVSATDSFQHRPAINIETFGQQSFNYLLENFIPAPLIEAYQSVGEHLLVNMRTRLAETSKVSHIRVHGDCHIGNILWRDNGPYFIDFDDARMAPAIQDIWMLLSGSLDQQRGQLEKILSGYEQFHHFNTAELNLIEVYRTLRIMYFSAWIGIRWTDPAFPRGFPWFDSARYWEEHILTLKEQLAALQEPAISL